MALVDLPDINVWIALSIPDHVHHERARTYWQAEAAAVSAFNTTTMLGLVRICSSSPISKGAPLTSMGAWSLYLQWMHLQEVNHLPEPRACMVTLNNFVSAGLITGRTWTDAYLAAFAVSASLRLVSFDSDFRRFPGLDFLHLKPEPL